MFRATTTEQVLSRIFLGINFLALLRLRYTWCLLGPNPNGELESDLRIPG
jgi:hypothetical protein